MHFKRIGKLILKIICFIDSFCFIFQSSLGKSILCFDVRCPNYDTHIHVQKSCHWTYNKRSSIILKKKYILFQRFHLKRTNDFVLYITYFVRELFEIGIMQIDSSYTKWIERMISLKYVDRYIIYLLFVLFQPIFVNKCTYKQTSFFLFCRQYLMIFEAPNAPQGS